MLKRVITAISLLLLTILVVGFLPVFPYFELVLALIVLLLAWEWSGFCYDLIGWRLSYSFVAVFGYFLFLYFESSLIIVFLVSICWSISIFRLYRFNGEQQNPLVALLSGLWLIIGFALAVLFLRKASIHALCIMFMLVWSTDILGLLVGKSLGKVKLTPVISPNKTWEGLYGGMLGGVFIGLACHLLYNIPLIKIVPISVLSVLICVLGDLFISCYKRECAIKDTGKILPGHGGLLDRLDGMIALAPFFYAFCWLADVPLEGLQFSF